MTNSVFAPPALGTNLALTGLPGGGSKIHDRSPYGNHGALIGATWKRLPSGLWALRFDGIDDYVSVPDHESFSNPGSQLTVIIWALRDVIGADHTLIGSWWDGTGRAYYINISNTNKAAFSVGTGGGTGPEAKSITGSTSIPAGAYYQIAGVYDGVNLRLFVNALSDATPVAQTGSVHNGTLPLFLGAYQSVGSPADFHKGEIALPRIYNRALSALEIQDSFNREKQFFGVW
jgi:hypothetical protein